LGVRLRAAAAALTVPAVAGRGSASVPGGAGAASWRRAASAPRAAAALRRGGVPAPPPLPPYPGRYPTEGFRTSLLARGRASSETRPTASSQCCGTNRGRHISKRKRKATTHKFVNMSTICATLPCVSDFRHTQSYGSRSLMSMDCDASAHLRCFFSGTASEQKCMEIRSDIAGSRRELDIKSASGCAAVFRYRNTSTKFRLL
jgi:hypothetical protein